MDHYETLGVARDASADDIKAAARREASRHHPDRGGDAQRMAMVNRARDVLLDPEKRANYDETGSETGRGTIEDAAASLLRQLFTQALGNTERRMLKWMREKLSALQDQAIARKTDAKYTIGQLTQRRANITAKKGVNLLHDVIDRQVKALQDQEAEAEGMLRVVGEARKMLDDYESSEEQPDQPVRSPDLADAMRYAFTANVSMKHW